MNVFINNMHVLQALLHEKPEKIIALEGKAESPKAKKILEEARNKGIRILEKNKKISGLCKAPVVKDLKSSDYDLGNLVLILDEIQDTRNLGSCLRSASFFGVDSVVIPKHDSADFSNPAAIETSTGAAYDLNLYKTSNTSELIKKLKKNDYWVTGFSEHASFDIKKQKFSGKNVLVFGNEEKGLRTLVQKNCDQLLKISKIGQTSSLNVSVAVSVALYDVTNKL